MAMDENPYKAPQTPLADPPRARRRTDWRDAFVGLFVASLSVFLLRTPYGAGWKVASMVVAALLMIVLARISWTEPRR